MQKFTEWLLKHDPELAESILHKAGALALPMAGAIGGGALGLAAGGPAGALAGWIGGKWAGTKSAEKMFPQATVELMSKKSRKQKK